MMCVEVFEGMHQVMMIDIGDVKKKTRTERVTPGPLQHKLQ